MLRRLSIPIISPPKAFATRRRAIAEHPHHDVSSGLRPKELGSGPDAIPCIRV